MSNDDKAPSSPAGEPAHHHDETALSVAPGSEACLEAISAHIEQHLGPVDSVFHEIVSDIVHIDVHIVRPDSNCNQVRLVTSGMSDLPMQVPDGSGMPAFAELMITLPPDWRLDQEAFQDENWYWPVRLLKVLARLPHRYATWLGFGHTIPNGDPAKPYASGSDFTGAIILPPVSAPQEFRQLSIPGKKDVHFFAVVPLYAEEMQFKLEHDAEALLDRFNRHRIDDIVRPGRVNATKKRFWLFG